VKRATRCVFLNLGCINGIGMLMIRSTARSAGVVILLAMNSCGSSTTSDLGTRPPGLSVAEAALQGGSAEIALQVSNGILRGAPNNIAALAVKGDALSLLGAHDQAETIFNALMKMDPNSVRANIGLGRIRLGKDPAAAESLFQTVLRHEPKNLTALNNIGIARDLLGRHADAQTAYRVALAANPDLDAARVNMALSMAMSGQAPAAVQLLRQRATEPGAPEKIRHDYAMVLAMAGNRAEAERILSQKLNQDEVRQALDNVPGTRTRGAAGGVTGGLASADGVRPDVVEVPETPTRSSPASRLARDAAPAAAPDVSVAALATPPPTVVRPRQTIEEDADVPPGQPVTPVAAAITYQRPLAFSMRAGDAFEPKADAAEGTIAAPSVVAMPASRPVQPFAPPPVRVAAADVVRAPTADASPMAASRAFAPESAASQTVASQTVAPQTVAPQPTAPQTVAAQSFVAQSVVPQYVVAQSVVAQSVVAGPLASQPVSSASVEARAAPQAAKPAAAPVEPIRASIGSGPTPTSVSTSLPAPAVAPTAGAPVVQARIVSPPVVATAPLAVSPTVSPTVATASSGSMESPAAPIAEAVHAPIMIASRTVEPRIAAEVPASIPAGQSNAAAAVQFAATASEESARVFWQSLAHRFPDVLGSRTPIVVRFDRNGTMFWRVRIEEGSVAEAQALCARVRAGGQDCFVPRS
jgi:Flp pilus assembly protein TadD